MRRLLQVVCWAWLGDGVRQGVPPGADAPKRQAKGWMEEGPNLEPGQGQGGQDVRRQWLQQAAQGQKHVCDSLQSCTGSHQIHGPKETRATQGLQSRIREKAESNDRTRVGEKQRHYRHMRTMRLRAVLGERKDRRARQKLAGWRHRHPRPMGARPMGWLDKQRHEEATEVRPNPAGARMGQESHRHAMTMPMRQMEERLNKQGVLRLTGLSDPTVRRAQNRGPEGNPFPPHHYVAGMRMWMRAEVEDWLAREAAGGFAQSGRGRGLNEAGASRRRRNTSLPAKPRYVMGRDGRLRYANGEPVRRREEIIAAFQQRLADYFAAVSRN